MPALADVHGGSGGDGGAFRVPEGDHLGYLAEVVTLGYFLFNAGSKQYYPVPANTDKAKQHVLAYFVLPEVLYSGDAPDDLPGKQMSIRWQIRNFGFNKDQSVEKWRTIFEKAMQCWFGQPVPVAQHANFLFGREWGAGPDQLVRGLETAQRQAQSKAKPGVPLGTSVMVRVVHSLPTEDGKTWANIGPFAAPDPPTGGTPEEMAAYAQQVVSFLPGLSPAPKELSSKYKWEDLHYISHADREALKEQRQAQGQDGQPAQSQQTADDPQLTEDDIPF